MKKLFITATCIVTVLSTFANNATDKNKTKKEELAAMNAVVATIGTKVTVTAISDLPYEIAISMKDAGGSDLYEGKLVKGEYSQSALLNLDQLGEGTYRIVLQNGKERCEKKITINTTKQLSVAL